jgi:catechol 2,3-dioxygenase-like lactoylglutathione lyase family enzyme
MTTPVIQGLGAVSAHVKDIAKARTFYTKTLGLREVTFDAEMKAAYYEIPGSPVALAIHQYDAGCKDMGGRPPGTVSGIVFQVASVPRAMEDLKKRGVTITEPNMMHGTMAAFADPDGNEYVVSGK